MSDKCSLLEISPHEGDGGELIDEAERVGEIDLAFRVHREVVRAGAGRDDRFHALRVIGDDLPTPASKIDMHEIDEFIRRCALNFRSQNEALLFA